MQYNDDTTGDQITALQKARWCYKLLSAGLGTPADHVKFILAQLSLAGAEMAQLDETGQKAADEIGRELDQAAKTLQTKSAPTR
jgi:hypothetical protein